MKTENKNQEIFFDNNALITRPILKNSFFYEELNKEQINGFQWLDDCNSVLDYGCGTGISIDLFTQVNDKKNFNIVGVDISNQVILLCEKKYPQYSFYKISNGEIEGKIRKNFDGAYIMHVLHHCEEYREIFENIYKHLKPNGKLLINDLTSKNPFIKLARSIFRYLPWYIKNRFNDDLIIDGEIPEKNVVDIDELTYILNSIGFDIIKIEYAHLFYFIVGWFDRFICFSKINFLQLIYKKIASIEDKFIHKFGLWRYCEVVSIYAVKRSGEDIKIGL